MSAVLEQVLSAYFTKSETLPDVLRRFSHDEIQEALLELVDTYANDVNSSALRERITLMIAKYEPRKKKLGFNGFNPQTNVDCDVKPINILSGTKDRLNGGGNFSDLTPERVDKYEQKGKSFHIIASGFVDGRLVYILEFPYRCIAKRIRKQVENRFPNWVRKAGEYVRGSTFSFTHYKDCSDLRPIFVNSDLERYQKYLTRELYELLRRVRGRLT